MIERIVNLQGLKTLKYTSLQWLAIERIINLLTHIGKLALFTENKKQKQKISINKSK